MKCLQMLLNSLKGKNKEISQNILTENGFVNIPTLHENVIILIIFMFLKEFDQFDMFLCEKKIRQMTRVSAKT